MGIRVDGLSPKENLGCFINGLHDEIGRDVKAMEPRTLSKALALAKIFEEKYSTNTKPKQFPNTTRNFSQNNTITNKTNQVTPKPTDATPKTNLPPLLPTPHIKPFNLSNQNINKKSPTEIPLRREKNLCYFCDEEFSLSHRCPSRQVMLLQLEDEEEIQSDSIAGGVEEEKTGLDNHHLSLNTMKGFNGVGTIRFTGEIGSIRVKILVDGGSLDDFI